MNSFLLLFILSFGSTLLLIVHAFIINSFIHSFIHLFIHSLILSFIYSFIHSFIHSLVHSFIRSVFLSSAFSLYVLFILLLSILIAYSSFQRPLNYANVRCFYKRDNPRLLLKPLKVECVHDNPELYIFYDVLREKEIDLIKHLSKPKVSDLNFKLSRWHLFCLFVFIFVRFSFFTYVRIIPLLIQLDAVLLLSSDFEPSFWVHSLFYLWPFSNLPLLLTKW